MARSRTRSSSRSSSGRQAASRKSSGRRAEAAPAGEESGGLGLDAGVAIVTTILLVVALLFLDRELASYGEGFLF